MKKLLSVLLAMAMLLTCVPLGTLSASAATAGENVHNTNVRYNDNSLTEDTGLNADFVFLANNYPQYLDNNLAQTCTDFCLECCNDVIQSYDKKNTWLLAYAECFVNGTGILIQELGSKLGITQSVEEEWLQKNTMEYLRLVSGCEDIIYDEWNNVAKKYKDFKFVLKNVDELDTELINEQKNLFIKQMSDYSSCFSEDEIAEIADSLISKEPNGIKKFFSNADHVVDLADALLLSCQMAEVEDAVLKRLRSNIDANTPLYDGITSVLKANAAHPARWVLEKYLSDQALDWIENELMDAAWDWSAGLLGVENLNVATLVVEITATILYEYVYQGAKIDELYGALVAYDFYLTVSNALMQQQLAFLQYKTNNQIVPEQTLSDYIFLYEAKRKAMLHYTEACINIDKTGYDSILENYQSYYEDDGQLVFDNYITMCMGQLKADIDAGKVTVENTHTVHNYSTYVYYEAKHPHYKCYQCLCGDVKADYSEPTIVSDCSSCAPPREYAMFPMEYINITQGVNGSFSHQGTKAIDIAGKDTGIDAAYAPFTGVVKRIYKEYVVWLESSNPVVFADGTVDYMTIMVMHDNDTSDLYVGKTIKQGERFFEEGTAGYATGNHIHLECAKGKFQGNGWYENSQGNWVIYNSINPYDALYLSSETVIKNDYGYNWKYVSSTPSTPITYATIDTGVYALKNKGNQLYMNVAYGLDENAQNIHTYEFGYWNSQLYEITPSTTTAGYMMRPLSSAARVVNVYADNVVSGKNVCIYNNTGDGSQRWNFEKVEDGFVIRNVQNPSCVLAVVGSSDVGVQTYSGADNQIWTLENVVSYDANGGTGAPKLQLKNYNESITLSATKPSKNGYIFKGWATDANATEAQYASGGAYNSNANIKLYAVWECIHTYDNGCDVDCNVCGAVRETEHVFSVINESQPTCNTYGKRRYACDICGYSYEEIIEKYISDWSTEYPTNVGEELIESKKEYRYREWKETTEPLTEDGWILDSTYTRMGEYGAWGNWSNSSITGNDNTQVETRTVYPYYYYKCPNCGAHMHVYLGCYTWAGGCGKSGINSGHYVQIDSTIPYSSAGLKDFHGTGRNYTYIDGQLVFQHRDGSKTQYRSRTRELETVYRYYRYTEWSDWSEECNAPNAMAEERTVYRYVVANLADHTYDNACDTNCNVCGAVREVEVIPGDANGDGRVNNRDLGLLQQYLNEWDVIVDTDAIDVNNDGRINNRDLGWLQTYLNE